MKLVTLMENTACRPSMACEHGLSLYLEAGGRKILFDMGQSGAFAENAERLGVDLAAVDLAVLSHGHYDHGGGIRTFLEINKKSEIYVSRYAFEPHYNAAGKDIGLDPTLPRERICFTEGSSEPVPGVCICTVPYLPADSAGMTTANGQPEDFRHEQYLLIREGERRILLSGCSHKGIVQIAEYFRPDVLVGGFHFMKTEDEAVLTDAARRLLALDCRYYTGHCTGQRQYAFLKQIMGSRLDCICAGTEISI